jgi:hypothetical protein
MADAGDHDSWARRAVGFRADASCRGRRGSVAAALAGLLAALAAVPAQAVEHGVGWLNDGGGVFAGQAVPDKLSEANILWRAKLPNWCNGSPIVVAGKAFAVSEPLEYSPILTCVDAETGKVLWQRDLDAVVCLPRQQQEEARALARRMWKWHRDQKIVAQETLTFYLANEDKFEEAKGKGEVTPAPGVAEPWNGYLKRISDLGCEIGGLLRSRAGGYSTQLEAPRNGEVEQQIRRLREMGLGWAYWAGFGTWEGVAFPTPCSDGKRVYTITGHYLYSCHDLDGNVVWQKRFPESRDERKRLAPEQAKRVTDMKRWPHGWPGQGTTSTSPALADGIVVSEVGSYTRAIEAATGKVLWELPNPVEIGQCMANPRIIDLHGTAVVLSGTNSEVIRLRDGRVLGRLPGSVHSKSFATGPAVCGEVVLTHEWEGVRIRSIVASRLRLEGDRLSVERLWEKEPREELGRFHLWRTVGHGGRFYSDQAAIDADTGKAVAKVGSGSDVVKTADGKAVLGEKGRVMRVFGGYETRGDHVLAGERLVVKNGLTGAIAVLDAKDLRVLSAFALPINPPDGAEERLKRVNANAPRWPRLGFAAAFMYRDRVYLRGFDFLYCIGRK